MSAPWHLTHDAQPLDPGRLHCIEVETMLLGTLLCYHKTRPVVLPALKPEHFVEPLHARIFAWIAQAEAAGDSITPLTAIARFRDDATVAELGGASKLVANLVASADVPLMAATHAQTVRLWADRRHLVELGEDMIDIAGDHESKPVDVISRAVTQLVEATAQDAPILQSMQSLTDRFVDAIRNGETGDLGAYAGTNALQAKMGGWRRGNLYIVAGRPGMGKSSFTPSVLLRTAERGHSILYVSLEMTAEELWQRAVTDLAYSDQGSLYYADIRKGNLTDWQRTRIERIAPRLAALPIAFIDKAGLTIGQIRMLAQQHERQHGKIDVIAIDHIGLIKAEETYSGNKVAETEAVSNALKVMAKDLQVAVVGLAQMNRQNEQREDKRPTLSDLRWSGAIEQDADVVLLLHREAYYLERSKKGDVAEEMARLDALRKCRNDLEVIIAKNRGDEVGTLEFWADMGSNAVRDKHG